MRGRAAPRRGRGRPLERPPDPVGPVRVDIDAHRAYVQGEEVELTPLEFKLLVTFMARVGRVQSREQLLSDVWEMSSEIETRTVDTHVKRLREKLGVARDLLETVRGVGYRLVEPGGGASLGLRTATAMLGSRATSCSRPSARSRTSWPGGRAPSCPRSWSCWAGSSTPGRSAPAPRRSRSASCSRRCPTPPPWSGATDTSAWPTPPSTRWRQGGRAAGLTPLELTRSEELGEAVRSGPGGHARKLAARAAGPARALPGPPDPAPARRAARPAARRHGSAARRVDAARLRGQRQPRAAHPDRRHPRRRRDPARRRAGGPRERPPLRRDGGAPGRPAGAPHQGPARPLPHRVGPVDAWTSGP